MLKAIKALTNNYSSALSSVISDNPESHQVGRNVGGVLVQHGAAKAAGKHLDRVEAAAWADLHKRLVLCRNLLLVGHCHDLCQGSEFANFLVFSISTYISFNMYRQCFEKSTSTTEISASHTCRRKKQTRKNKKTEFCCRESPAYGQYHRNRQE